MPHLGGRQYVAVLSAGALVGGSKRGDSLWLFSLDGTLMLEQLRDVARFIADELFSPHSL